MIYFYCGTDIDKLKDKSNELANSLLKKKPDASVFRLNSENMNNDVLAKYIGSQGLFSNKYIVILDRLFDKKTSNSDTRDFIVEKLKEISESQNIFIIVEGKLEKTISNKIEKFSEKVVKYDLDIEDKKEDSNVFALADAFSRKNKKDAWILYRKAIDRGEAPEALHGMIFWKIKTMILSGGNSLWSKDELIKTMDEMITLYHDSRRGAGELETLLESFILH